MRRSLFALLIACGHPAALKEPAARAVPYCLAITAQTPVDGYATETYARVCFDRGGTCRLVRERAIALARLAAITAVGECKEER